MKRGCFPILLSILTAGSLTQAATNKYNQQGSKLYGSGAVGAAQQGYAVAISGDGNTALVGGPVDNPSGTQGAVWAYTRTNGAWSQQGTKLVPTGDVAPGNAGWSVALSSDGNTALIGAPNENTSQFTGAAWVFTRAGGAWTQQQKLVGHNAVGSANQGLGVALSADGKTAVVGGPGDSSGTGAAWVFGLQNGSWTEKQKLTPGGATGPAQAGYSVAISGDSSTIIVGGPTDAPVATYAQGAAWVYTLSNGTWSQQGKLVARSPFMSEQGYSVALSNDGNTAALGGPISGGAFVFTRSNGVWTNRAGPLASPKGSTQAGDGNAVALSGDGNTLVVGGPGDNDAWVYTYTLGNSLCANQNTTGGGCWTLLQELAITPSPDGVNELATTWTGFSAAISNDGSAIILGGPKDSTQATANLGAAWVYAATAGSITATAGTPQTAQLGAAFATNLKATVSDSRGSPAAGVTVTFIAPSAGASGTFPGSSLTATAVSDSTGTAQSPVLTANNTAGSWTVTATAPGAAASALFNLTNAAAGNVNITLQTTPANLLVSFDKGAFAQAPVTQSLAIGSSHTIATQSPQAGTGGTQNFFVSWSDGLPLSHTISVPGTDTAYTATFQNSGSAPSGQFKQQGSKLVGKGAVGPTSAQGSAVAVSADGNTAIVGGLLDAPTSSGPNPGSYGAAWVWVRTNGVWTQQQKLTTPDAAAGQQFGFSVGLSGDGNTAIVGGPGTANGSAEAWLPAGAAWIFTRNNGVWTQTQKLTISGQAVAINDAAGAAVALSGDGLTAIVGAPYHTQGYGGAFVFTRAGNSWTQQAQLEGTNVGGSYPQLGVAVSLSNDGNVAILGAPSAVPTGGALIFARTGGAWKQQGGLLTQTGGSVTSAGASVAISGDGQTAILGVPNNQNTPAAALVFVQANGVWAQQGSPLAAPRSGAPSLVSNYVTLSRTGDIAVIGGQPDDAADVYVRVGGTWSQKSQITPSDTAGDSAFGTAVALSADGSTLLVGGPTDANVAGAAWIFASSSTTTIGVPSIQSGGIVPLYSSVSVIQPGSWISIYGANFASSTVTWNGDFPTTLGGTSVTINGKPAYLWFVSSGQINLQAPDDTTAGSVSVAVNTPAGTAISTVTLAPVAPSFSLLDGKHVAGIILRSNGSGAYGGGLYDIVGPTGTSLGYKTVAARAGDTVEIFGVGFGPTDPFVPAGAPYTASAATKNPVQFRINNVAVTPSYSGITSAGLYQFNLQIPAGAGTGDVTLQATVSGSQTPSGVVLSLQ
jgi:uncharacterized protein (TIGR03437 family)